MENSTQRLFEMLHQDDDPVWYRSAGGMLCQMCIQPYRKHPYFDEHLSTGHPIDRRLCDGTVVHL